MRKRIEKKDERPVKIRGKNKIEQPYQLYSNRSWPSRVSPPEFRFPNCASGSQEIGDFLGVALQVQQYAVLFAALKRTHL
jgi:hypothetical protein